MSKKPHTKPSQPGCDTSRRTVILSLAGAAVAGFSAPQAARAMSDGTLVQPASANTVVVKMNNALQFVPNKITIKVGTTVEWRNVESYPHSATADPALARNPRNVELPPGAKPFHSGRINGGSSWNHTFTVAGTYRYFCVPHEDAGMLGTIIVV